MVKGGLNVDTGTMKNVTILKFTNGRPLWLAYADRAKWEGIDNNEKKLNWMLYNGFTQTIDNATSQGASVTAGFSSTATREIKQPPSELSLYQKETEQMSFAEISRVIARLRGMPNRPADDIRNLEVERWNKLALPLSSLIFAMLALPLGVRPHRSSSSVGLGLSVFLIFCYWMVWRYTSAMAVTGQIPPLVGAFLADILGIVAAIILLKRAAK